MVEDLEKRYKSLYDPITRVPKVDIHDLCYKNKWFASGTGDDF